MRRGGQPARARGRCVGAALESESIKCAWAGAGACARSRCAPGGGAASASGRAQPRAGGARRDACGNFSPAPQVRVPAFSGAVFHCQPRVPAPPPLPPPASSSFPAPRAAGPQGTPQAQPHPTGAARSHAPAAACRERTQRASGARALQVGGNPGWAQVQRTGPLQHGNMGCPPPPAPSSPTRQSPFREFFASCLLRRGWGRGRRRSFSISLVPSRCQPPVSKSLTLLSTYGRVNNYLALEIGSAAPSGQSLQPGKTTTSGGGERREASWWPGVSGSSLASSPPLSAAPRTAPGALGIFSVVTWAAALRAFLDSASAAPFSLASQQPHQLQALTWPCLSH